MADQSKGLGWSAEAWLTLGHQSVEERLEVMGEPRDLIGLGLRAVVSKGN